MNDTDTLRITADPGTQNIEITREFSATREQILRAHTDPEIYARWIGPRGYETEVTDLDPHHGGSWAFTQRNPGGEEFSFRGVFHGDPTVDRMQQTFEYLGSGGDILFETMTLEDLGDGRTLPRTVSVASSVEARDAMVESGMERGVREGYDQLDEILADLTS